MSAADKGDKRIIKRPQSPFIFLLFTPPTPANFVYGGCVVCLLVSPLGGGRVHQGPG